jgi:hypothetical protein
VDPIELTLSISQESTIHRHSDIFSKPNTNHQLSITQFNDRKFIPLHFVKRSIASSLSYLISDGGFEFTNFKSAFMLSKFKIEDKGLFFILICN